MEAQTITNLLTAGLGVATVWLAIETRRMAVAAKSSIDLESHPYLSLRGLFIKPGTIRDLTTSEAGALRIGLRLFNPGKTLVTYNVDSISVSLNGMSSDTPRFETTGGVIHPSEETIFFYPVIRSAVPIQAPSEGEIAFSITYWSVITEKKKLKGKIKYLITSATDHEWVYLEGPNYT
jgi:hypothetical protein